MLSKGSLGTGVLKICSNLTGEHPCRSEEHFWTLLLNKLTMLRTQYLGSIKFFCNISDCGLFI